MNDEIKEILEEIDNKIIPNEHWNKIKDCITNLQQENERLKKEKKKLSNDLAEAILFNQKRCEQNKELQQRIERLKEENRHIFANVNDDVLLRSNAMYYAELQECKKRIDKAIEYIKEKTTHYTSYLPPIPKKVPKLELQREAYDKLIQILGGDE